jgi:hypothetical protein
MPATPDAPPAVLSPNSVLANALLRTIDMIRPKVVANRPKRIVFVVGTQINGAPHLGTNIVQTSAFLLAKLARRAFSVDTTVRFSALDNAPYEVTLDPETHRAYQITYFHALGKDGITGLIERYYREFFNSLSDATDTEYELEPTPTSRGPRRSAPSSCAPWNASTRSAGGSTRPPASSIRGCHARPAAGPRSAPSRPAWCASRRTEPSSPLSATSTATMRCASTPSTAATLTWPPSTAMSSRNAPSCANATCCT